MTEGIGDCMPLALRSVGDAVRLDSENRAKVWLMLRIYDSEFVIVNVNSYLSYSVEKGARLYFVQDIDEIEESTKMIVVTAV